MRLAVYDESGKLIGQRFLSMEQLRPGYRHVTLRNEANSPLPLATLFVKIDLKTYIPESLANFVDALAGSLRFACSPLVYLKATAAVIRSDLLAMRTDPRAFLTLQEKRAKAMEAMGIDQRDLMTNVPLAQSSKGGAKANAAAGANGKAGEQSEQKAASSAPRPGPAHSIRTGTVHHIELSHLLFHLLTGRHRLRAAHRGDAARAAAVREAAPQAGEGDRCAAPRAAQASHADAARALCAHRQARGRRGIRQQQVQQAVAQTQVRRRRSTAYAFLYSTILCQAAHSSPRAEPSTREPLL